MGTDEIGLEPHGLKHMHLMDTEPIYMSTVLFFFFMYIFKKQISFLLISFFFCLHL